VPRHGTLLFHRREIRQSETEGVSFFDAGASRLGSDGDRFEVARPTDSVQNVKDGRGHHLFLWGEGARRNETHECKDGSE
jgi:hypothetical protein